MLAKCTQNRERNTSVFAVASPVSHEAARVACLSMGAKLASEVIPEQLPIQKYEHITSFWIGPSLTGFYSGDKCITKCHWLRTRLDHPYGMAGYIQKFKFCS